MKCPRCGLETPVSHHVHDECIRDLKRCHDIAKQALLKVHGIAKAFVQSPKVLLQVKKIVEDALRDLNVTCP